MKTIDTVYALRDEIGTWRKGGARVALVPTMGAFHAGHLALVHEARRLAECVVVSIFVNPKQFAPHEDFARYPREVQSDSAKLAENAPTDILFVPDGSELYPQDFATEVEVGGPSAGLETDFRPHFFRGVATVVVKLLIASIPDVAMFGEKDYQQLLVVRRVVKDLGIPTEIAGVPIVREPDGLAMSSRNAYLSSEERAIAGKLNVMLKEATVRARAGVALREVEETTIQSLRGAGFDAVDYVAVRDSRTLDSISSLEAPARVLAAVRIGKTRLIDNMAV